MGTFTWDVPEDCDFWPCPMGCGGGTTDEGGGPCRSCWNKLDEEEDDGDDLADPSWIPEDR